MIKTEFFHTLQTAGSAMADVDDVESNGGIDRAQWVLNGTEFSQTLQKAGSTMADVDDVKSNGATDRAQWVLNGPKPPGLRRELMDTIFPGRNKNRQASDGKEAGILSRLFSALKIAFPILSWGGNYEATKFKSDVLAGLTLASLCIPQSIGYATLAKLDPQIGLYTSVVPPLIYAVMGTSREIAIGPVAVVSLLLSSMLQKLQDPAADPISYRKLALTTTFFAGIFQAAFGLLRSGFLVDFLSHAAIVGFMGGAAIVIGLQQLKGLLGISHFTNKTDVVSVTKAVWTSLHQEHWNPYNFLLGFPFLCFILMARLLGQRKKKLFWVPAIAPLVSVVAATLIVFLTRADKHGVKIVKHIKRGLNPSSAHQLQFSGPNVGQAAKTGLIIAIVALTEAIAVGRSFARVKGYHIDGNKEMVAIGFMNIIGSFSSCYVATGSFSRSAVNYSAGCETAVSNIVMAATVVVCLQVLTRLFYYTPTAILASIILSALPGLMDFREAYRMWKIDKLDFLACLGAFLGGLFASVEIGLLVAVSISFAKIIVISIRPGTELLGKIPTTADVFADIDQYPVAVSTPGALIFRLKSALLFFANANSIRERIMNSAVEEDQHGKESGGKKVQLVILDISNLMDIDTSGIASLEELQQNLDSVGIQLAITNPRWQVIHKLKAANLVNKIGGRVYLSIGEAINGAF